MRSTKQFKSVAVPLQANEPKQSNEVHEPVDHLADAFYYDQSGRQRDLETTIRSVALILESATDSGNNDVPATLAFGLSILLHECAKRSRALHSTDDVIRASRGALIDQDKETKLYRQLVTGDFVPFDLEIRPGRNFMKLAATPEKGQ